MPYLLLEERTSDVELKIDLNVGNGTINERNDLIQVVTQFRGCFFQTIAGENEPKLVFETLIFIIHENGADPYFTACHQYSTLPTSTNCVVDVAGNGGAWSAVLEMDV
ncbi:hypothetical protein D3C75_1092530 [compost metagenome]